MDYVSEVWNGYKRSQFRNGARSKILDELKLLKRERDQVQRRLDIIEESLAPYGDYVSNQALTRSRFSHAAKPLIRQLEELNKRINRIEDQINAYFRRREIEREIELIEDGITPRQKLDLDLFCETNPDCLNTYNQYTQLYNRKFNSSKGDHFDDFADYTGFDDIIPKSDLAVLHHYLG